MPPSLAETQNLLYRLITATSGVEEGLAAEKNLPREGITGLVCGDSRVSAIERVGIYANMYFYRLLDAAKEDFPATFRVLGEANFHNLITGYLVEYPPRDPSINEAFRHLAEFVRGSQWLETWPYLSSLIGLERALVEVFLSRDLCPLNSVDLRAMPWREWPSLWIAAHPATQVLDCEWRVDELVRAVEEGLPLAEPTRGPTAILLWRTNCVVSHRRLDDLERAAFKMIQQHTELGTLCELIAFKIGEEAAPPVVQRMLSRWLDDGVLIRAVAK
jgi:hypothetical protein